MYITHNDGPIRPTFRKPSPSSCAVYCPCLPVRAFVTEEKNWIQGEGTKLYYKSDCGNKPKQDLTWIHRSRLIKKIIKIFNFINSIYI